MEYNKLYDEIYNEITETLDSIIFEDFKDDDILEYDEYYIKIYHPDTNAEDKTYITTNRKMLQQFLIDGYAMSIDPETGKGLEFMGYDSSKDLKKKTVAMKAAFMKSNNEMIALSVYNGTKGGRKCVGITATTNDEYRTLGKLAVKEIIKHDISHYKSFYWCECSGSIENYYKKFGGFKIPVVYVPEILNLEFGTELIQLDEYHYNRYSRALNGYLKKVIYGFKDSELFNRYITEYTEEYKQAVERIEGKLNDNILTEDYDFPFSEIDVAFEILDIFITKEEEGVYDYPQYALKVLRKYKDYLGSVLRSDKYFSRYSRRDIINGYKQAEHYLEIFNPLVLHYIP